MRISGNPHSTSLPSPSNCRTVWHSRASMLVWTGHIGCFPVWARSSTRSPWWQRLCNWNPWYIDTSLKPSWMHFFNSCDIHLDRMTRISWRSTRRGLFRVSTRLFYTCKCKVLYTINFQLIHAKKTQAHCPRSNCACVHNNRTESANNTHKTPNTLSQSPTTPTNPCVIHPCLNNDAHDNQIYIYRFMRLRI